MRVLTLFYKVFLPFSLPPLALFRNPIFQLIFVLIFIALVFYIIFSFLQTSFKLKLVAINRSIFRFTKI